MANPPQDANPDMPGFQPENQDPGPQGLTPAQKARLQRLKRREKAGKDINEERLEKLKGIKAAAKEEQADEGPPLPDDLPDIPGVDWGAIFDAAPEGYVPGQVVPGFTAGTGVPLSLLEAIRSGEFEGNGAEAIYAFITAHRDWLANATGSEIRGTTMAGTPFPMGIAAQYAASAFGPGGDGSMPSWLGGNEGYWRNLVNTAMEGGDFEKEDRYAGALVGAWLRRLQEGGGGGEEQQGNPTAGAVTQLAETLSAMTEEELGQVGGAVESLLQRRAAKARAQEFYGPVFDQDWGVE